PVQAQILRGGDLSHLHTEGRADLFAAADTGNRPGAREIFAGPGFETQRFGRSVELFAGPGALAKFFGFSTGQFLRFFLFERSHDLIAYFVQSALVGGQYLFQRENNVSTIRANWLADFSFAQTEDGVFDFRRIPQLDKLVGS